LQLAYNSGQKTNQLQAAFSRQLQLRRLLMLKPFLLISAAVILFAIASIPGPVSAAGRAPQAAAPTAPPTAAAIERAKKLYGVDCAVCHGDNGNGKTDLAKDMSLTLDDWTAPGTLASKPDQELFDTIRKGKDKMPPEAEGRAKNDDVWALIAYIRSMSKPGFAPAAN
jgi:mono/diheme cytochrome c family protein